MKEGDEAAPFRGCESNCIDAVPDLCGGWEPEEGIVNL